jgi:hypothetical protein
MNWYQKESIIMERLGLKIILEIPEMSTILIRLTSKSIHSISSYHIDKEILYHEAYNILQIFTRFNPIVKVGSNNKDLLRSHQWEEDDEKGDKKEIGEEDYIFEIRVSKERISTFLKRLKISTKQNIFIHNYTKLDMLRFIDKEKIDIFSLNYKFVLKRIFNLKRNIRSSFNNLDLDKLTVYTHFLYNSRKNKKLQNKNI